MEKKGELLLKNKRKGIRIFFRFTIINVLITMLNFALYVLFNELVGMWYVFSNTISYLISIVISTVVNSRYVFSSQEGKKGYLRFFSMKIVLGILSTIVLWMVVDLGGGNKYIGVILVTGLFFIISYFFSKSIFESGSVVNMVMKLLRTKHWIKNILIFIPLICSGNLFCSVENAYLLVLIFLGMCFLSSFIYIENDIKDCEKDRLNPRKAWRPIASGSISIKRARFYQEICAFAAFVSVAILLLIMPFKNWIMVVSLMAIYLTINVLYSSFCIKDIPILEIMIVVAGYMIRLLIGGVSIRIPITAFLGLTTYAVALYLVTTKRYSEKLDLEDEARKSIIYYSRDYLRHIMNTSSTLMLVFFALWALERFEVFYTVFLIIGAILIYILYSYDVDKFGDGDPVSVLFEDKVLLVMSGLYLGIMVILMSWK